ncbi:MAG: hypothetical protein R3Y24_06820 [Eubacteriales bacterium]
MQKIYGEKQNKLSFWGDIISIQPRSNVWRYLVHNRTHSLTGYNLFIRGSVEDEEKQFAVAISEKQQNKYEFHIGDAISGTAWTKKYPEIEYADYYRVGGLKKEKVEEVILTDQAPWIAPVSDLATYEWRGARMLDYKCWKNKCFQCKWSAMANVTIEYDFGVT